MVTIKKLLNHLNTFSKKRTIVERFYTYSNINSRKIYTIPYTLPSIKLHSLDKSLNLSLNLISNTICKKDITEINSIYLYHF